MKFLYPQILWASFLIAIPIIIHLFRFRKFKKINFSNTAFLTSVVLERQNKNKLKNLILLFIRIFAILALVFAFSQPIIPSSGLSQGKKLVSIYIDNSPSMENINKEGVLIDQARNIAKKIVKGHGKNDKFLIISNSFRYKEQQYYTHEDAIQLIDEIGLSPSLRTYQSVFDKISSINEEFPGMQNAFYIISDFQKSNGNPEKLPSSELFKIFLSPVQVSSFSNLSIDSCWFSSPFIYPMKPFILYVKVRNYGNTEHKDLTLELNLDGRNKIISFDINENELKTIEIPLVIDRTGWLKCTVSLSDYPVTFDDIFYFSFRINESCKVLIINDNSANHFLSEVFATDSYFNVASANLNNVDINSLSNFNFIILNEPNSIPSGLNPALIEYLRNGGTILLIPATENLINLNSYNNFCKSLGIIQFEQKLSTASKIQKMNVQHPVFQGIFEKKQEKIDFPKIKKSYSRAASTLSTEYQLMSYDNNEPFLTIANIGKGNIFLLSVPLNQQWSNFVNHPMFLPLLYQMAIYKSHSLPLAFTLGKDKVIELPLTADTKTPDIKIKTNGNEFIPNASFYKGSLVFQPDENFSKPGFYNVFADKQFTLAFNYSRTESNLENYSINDLKSIRKNNPHIKLINTLNPNLQQKITEQNEGRILWKILIWIALLFLLAEVLITRFFNKI